MQQLASPRLQMTVWALLGLHIALLYFTLDSFTGLLNEQGHPLGADFITYWAASHLAQIGSPTDAYHAASLLAAEKLVAPVNMPHTGWYYPPQFLLLVYPLAYMNYALAYAAFSLLGLCLYLGAFAKLTRGNGLLILAAAFPALFLNITSGQNGLITVSLAALSLYYLEKKPVLAGTLMGLLCIKPQLLLLFPLMMLWTQNWRALKAFIISSTSFAGLATWVLGTDIWPTFLSGLNMAKTYLETDIPLERMPTVFALVRQIDCSLAWAYGLHALVAALAIVTLLATWRLSQQTSIRGIALVAATLLISPYLFDYDLVWQILPILWLYQLGHKSGWLAGERALLVITWSLLLYVKLGLYLVTGQVVLVGAVVNLALLWTAYRRARHAF